MWSAVNVLKDAPHIWDPTKTHDTQVTLFHINEKLVQKSIRQNFGSFWDRLTRLLPKGVLKQ